MFHNLAMARIFVHAQAFALFVIDQIHVLVARRRFGILDPVGRALDRQVRARHHAVLAPDHDAMLPQRFERAPPSIRRAGHQERHMPDAFRQLTINSGCQRSRWRLRYGSSW